LPDERWRQENFFKYMREDFLIDALVDYQIEAEDPTRTILNPERRALDEIRMDPRRSGQARTRPPPRTCRTASADQRIVAASESCL
jgi:hypothetical protein